MSYLVDTPANLELVRIALDTANGLRAADGTPTPRRARIFRNGVEVTGHPLFDPNERGVFVGTRETVAPAIVGDDGTAALELPAVPEVVQHLGKTRNGVALPRAQDLVQEAQLPARVKAEIDRRRQLAQIAQLEKAAGLRAG